MGIIKITRVHPLGTMNKCAKCHNNPSDNGKKQNSQKKKSKDHQSQWDLSFV